MKGFLDRLPQEAKEDLQELMQLEAFKYVLAWIDELAEKRAKEILRYDLSTGNDRELALIKARGEGAIAMARAFKNEVLQAKNGKIVSKLTTK